MKKHFVNALFIATVVMTGFSACKEEDPVLVTPTNTMTETALGSPIGSTLTACNRVVSPFSATTNTYVLGMRFNNTYKKFGIEGIGLLNFKNIDKVKFEFSGLYADRTQQIKIYYIRRSDGLYLTFNLSLAYRNKITPGNGVELQQWVVNNLGSNRYNLILYNFGPCYWARTYVDASDGLYKIGAGSPTAVENNSLGYTTLYMFSGLSVPPVIN